MLPDFSHTFWGVSPPPLSALPYRPRLHLPARFLRSALSAPDVTRWVSCTPLCTGRPRLHLPVRFLSTALSAPDVSRWVSCVTVSDLCRVSLCAQCGLCGHQLAVGCCTFVGCHGRGRHQFIARARSVGNGGTASARAATVEAGTDRPSKGQCVYFIYLFK